jgi:hypothetical protein
MRCSIAWTWLLTLWLEDGVGGEALEAVGDEDSESRRSLLAVKTRKLYWMRRMSLWLQDGVGEEALEALGEVVGKVSDEVLECKRCTQAWRLQIALSSEHGVGVKAPKPLGEAVGEDDGGCRVLGSCSVRDSWTLLSGMLLVPPES